MVIGSFVTPALLGFYTVGNRVTSMAVGQVLGPIASVLFPALSRMKHDLPKLRRAYLRVQAITCAIAFPMAAGLIVLAEPIVLLVLGEKWLPAVPLIQGIAAAEALRTMHHSGPLALATGHTKALFRRDLQVLMVRVPLLFGGILIGQATDVGVLLGAVLGRLLATADHDGVEHVPCQTDRATRRAPAIHQHIPALRRFGRDGSGPVLGHRHDRGGKPGLYGIRDARDADSVGGRGVYRQPVMCVVAPGPARRPGIGSAYRHAARPDIPAADGRAGLTRALLHRRRANILADRNVALPPSNDTIAVIIPTFNSARFVERAIRSALGEQAATEVIVVDDASCDDTLDVVSAIGKSEPRLRIFAQTSNAGPSAARNRAIRETRSAWIALLDADDAYVEGRLAKLLALAETVQADMVADNLVYYDGHTRKALGPSVHPHPSPRTITLEKLFRSTPEGGKDYVTLKPMMKRSFLLQGELSYDEAIRNGEDFDLYAKCLAGGAKYVADLEQMTYLYTSPRKRNQPDDHQRPDQCQAKFGMVVSSPIRRASGPFATGSGTGSISCAAASWTADRVMQASCSASALCVSP